MQQNWQSKASKIRKITLHHGRKKTRGKIYSTKEAEEQSLGGYQKLPKPSTTHPPGHRQRHRQAFIVKHRPCASLGGSKPASMANQPPIEKHQKKKKYTATRLVPLLAKTKTCKILINQ